ncbi:MAG: hypothetical protein AAGI24_00190 [Pseudomonadota bacterium]
MRGFNERQLKQLVEKNTVKRPKVEAQSAGYQVYFDLGQRLHMAGEAKDADGTLTTFRGSPKRFRSHRTLIQNMKKLGIARWECELGQSED